MRNIGSYQPVLNGGFDGNLGQMTRAEKVAAVKKERAGARPALSIVQSGLD